MNNEKTYTVTYRVDAPKETREDGRIKLILCHGPGMLRDLLHRGGIPFNPETTEMASKLYALAEMLPTLPAGHLLAIVKGDLDVDFSKFPESVSIRGKHYVPHHVAMPLFVEVWEMLEQRIPEGFELPSALESKVREVLG